MTRKKHRNPKLAPVTDPVQSANASGLRYVTDRVHGIRRRRIGRSFRYHDAKGRPLRHAAQLDRIKSLAIPPAWTDVWISPFRDSHLQATGRDARGRKQYRYHFHWRRVRDETKYDRMMMVGRTLPVLRARVAKDLARPGLPRVKVIATVVKLLEATLIRVGNEEYARENNSFGLTTMRDQHVKVRGSKIRFRFRGKSGIGHELDLDNPRLARIVRRCQDLPGQELFQYFDEEGKRRCVDSRDVNNYLREVTAVDLTAKDFRTWAGTVLAARALREFEHFDSKAQAKRNVIKAIENVAKRLGNTRAVCQRCYIHPAVVSSYIDGSLLQILAQRAEREMAESLSALKPEEAAVMAILEQQLKTEAKKKAA
ncbi:MAG TPA: DNA topoisomerase IB, partial [Candidatus Binatia bacterium]|nr:DNA topoisomerase IB [Candidatus Binatia bacterium]